MVLYGGPIFFYDAEGFVDWYIGEETLNVKGGQYEIVRDMEGN